MKVSADLSGHLVRKTWPENVASQMNKQYEAISISQPIINTEMWNKYLRSNLDEIVCN